MIPKKDGDSGIEVCSIEDPSPTTPHSVTTFSMQCSSKINNPQNSSAAAAKQQHLNPQAQLLTNGDPSSNPNLPTLPFIYLKKAQSCNQDGSTPGGPYNQPHFVESEGSACQKKFKPFLKQVKQQMKEVNQCIKTEPGSDVKRQCRHLDAAVMRVITLEGDEVIGEASELTVSKSNVNLGGRARNTMYAMSWAVCAMVTWVRLKWSGVSVSMSP